MARILIVDDDAAFRGSLAETVGDLGHEVLEAGSTAAGLTLLAAHAVDAAIVDLRMPEEDGLVFLQRAPAIAAIPCIMLTAYASGDNTIEAIRLGAFDHLTKPVPRAALVETLERALRQSPAATEDASAMQSATGDERNALVGDSEAMRQVFKQIGRAATSDATVLILGETGTGKELVARALHRNGLRAARPFVAINCAAIPAELIESELFGHVKGAFTGADKDKVGRFQLADGGTLFLDEIGEISPEIQVKLLRVLQERCFEPVGSSTTVHVDVRLITATNRNLEEMMADGEFREDLYYRLNVITVTLPPLRERADDVYDLAFTFLHRAARRLEKSVTQFDEAALAVLNRYHWPGNVRELQNVVERAVVLADGPSVTIEDLPAELIRRSTEQPPKALPVPPSRTRKRLRPAGRPKPATAARALDDSESGPSEREQLVAALRDAGGNKAEAARLLGLPRSTFFSKLKKHKLK